MSAANPHQPGEAGALAQERAARHVRLDRRHCLHGTHYSTLLMMSLGADLAFLHCIHVQSQVSSGMSLFLPAGCIHAVSTVADTFGFTGAFLLRDDIDVVLHLHCLHCRIGACDMSTRMCLCMPLQFR